MPGRDDFVGGFAGQNIGDVARPPRLPDPRDARQDLLCERPRVGDRIELLEAPVARAAVVTVVRLAEILDQRAMAAPRPRGVALHVAQQGARALAPLAVGLEHLPPADEIAPGIDQHAFRRQPVAPRAARLLLIMLRRSRRARMDDEAHVRSVDPHPERHRRDHDVRSLVEKHFLVAAAHFVGQARVIRHRAMALALQPFGERLDLAP